MTVSSVSVLVPARLPVCSFAYLYDLSFDVMLAAEAATDSLFSETSINKAKSEPSEEVRVQVRVQVRVCVRVLQAGYSQGGRSLAGRNPRIRKQPETNGGIDRN